MHYRIAHINHSIIENKEDVLRDIKILMITIIRIIKENPYLHMTYQSHFLE